MHTQPECEVSQSTRQQPNTLKSVQSKPEGISRSLVRLNDATHALHEFVERVQGTESEHPDRGDPNKMTVPSLSEILDTTPNRIDHQADRIYKLIEELTQALY